VPCNRVASTGTAVVWVHVCRTIPREGEEVEVRRAGLSSVAGGLAWTTGGIGTARP
jgi:hypothetical protein